MDLLTEYVIEEMLREPEVDTQGVLAKDYNYSLENEIGEYAYPKIQRADPGEMTLKRVINIIMKECGLEKDMRRLVSHNVKAMFQEAYNNPSAFLSRDIDIQERMETILREYRPY